VRRAGRGARGGEGEGERGRRETEQIFTPPLLALTNLHFLNGRVERSGRVITCGSFVP
jgi:hypothetical protein